MSDNNVAISKVVSVSITVTELERLDVFDFDFNTSFFSYDAATLMSQVFLGVSIFLVNEVTDFVALGLCTYNV
jgi:hypothetical protein